MISFLKRMFARCLPSGMRRSFKRRYYVRILQNFREEQWPGTSSVKPFIRQGDCVIDVGANVGYVTMLFSKWVGAGGKVYSVEPIPETYDTLYHNVQSLGLANVTTLCFAASSKNELGRMVVPDGNFYESHVASNGGIPIELRTLDSVFASRNEKISFIKIDVEGHEEAVILGAQEMLNRWRPTLFIEVNENPDDAKSSAFRMFSFLQGLGYSTYVFRDGAFALRQKGERAGDYLFRV